ncbi:hypothetical protein SAMN02745216_02085 [Desulfatibacillum alkenivorans DSM 16219]|jgi:hypothetical protein|uniref:Uncharacterized protein n=1 Tax=Desulfatibacillum alkenivorans DSM 16219 TaxID=1121393 RepID=A0A1M6LB23_9BACT|nr:hypothetical protein [Desulfatibacillum alkenivorans]SHJ68373.1 hypothetical protein SAMN02745216_02085 [Desulfatibacillum alkenivorans DSM 16219]
MPNYEMKFSVSEAAKYFRTDRDRIKKWAYIFSDYLEPAANPPKGTPRKFSAEDLRVFAYVFYYWEDEADIEAIKIGLNTNGHYEDIYDNFITGLTPLFIERPEGLNEDWLHGALFDGMSEYGDIFEIADSYKNAGDILVDAAIDNDEAFELVNPILFNYRHATELYLKATIGKWKKTHDLVELQKEFIEILKSEFDATLPKWFSDIVLVFNEFDPKGTTFRYGGRAPREVWVDVRHIKTLMGWMSKSFRRIGNRRLGLQDFD